MSDHPEQVNTPITRETALRTSAFLPNVWDAVVILTHLLGTSALRNLTTPFMIRFHMGQITIHKITWPYKSVDPMTATCTPGGSDDPA
jgi:hypothetical protein